MTVRDVSAASCNGASPRLHKPVAAVETRLDRLPALLLVALTAAVCLIFASLSLRLSIQPENVAPIWPVNAIVMALMMRMNRRRWHWALLGQAIGGFAANLIAAIPFASSCCYVSGNALETVVAVIVMTRLGTERIDFSSLRDFVRVVVTAGPVNAATSAILAGALVLFARTSEFLTLWELRASADGLGMLIVVPMLLGWRRPARGRTASLSQIEAVCLLCVFVPVSYYLFCRHMPTGPYIVNRPLLIAIPFLVWTALRTNVFTVCAMALIISTFAAAGICLGRGPFVASEATVQQAVGILQISLMCWTICGLTMAVVIVENRDALQALFEANEFNAQIISNVQDGIIVTDLEMRYRVWSPAMERLSGLPATAVLGRSPIKLFPFLREIGVVAMMERAMAGETVSSPDFPYEVPETGRKGWNWQLMGPLRSADGRITGVITTVRDITGRKEAQDSLCLFQTLIDHSNDGIVVVAPDSARFLHANERFCFQTGYTREQLSSMSVWDVSPQMHLAVFLETAAELRKTGTMILEAVQRHKDGTTIPVELSIKCVRLDQEYFVAVVRDATERKRGEELLRQSHERFQVLADAAFEGIVFHEERAIIDCNEQFAQMHGYPRDELIGSRVERLIRPEDREGIFTCMMEGRAANIQYIGVRKDGSSFHAEARGRTMSYSGRAARIVAIRDVTHRVRMEEMAIKSEKMLSIGGLAAGMAHEINNPLAIMMQNAEVVVHRINSDSSLNRAAAERAGTTIEAIRAYMQDREILEMLDGIHKSGVRAASIIRNMLAFSHPNSTGKSLHPLDELMNQAIELAHADSELKKLYDLDQLEIIREFDPELDPVFCHGGEVQQVLFNLFKNAVQATSAKMVRAPRITVRTRREIDHARIEVEDNGIGIPESLRRRIFEPFFTTKSPGEGTGLGLFVSYFIISEHHKGTMRVNPVPRGGSRFEVMLPLGGQLNASCLLPT